MDINKLKGQYARLKAIKDCLNDDTCAQTTGYDYNKIINDIGTLTGEDMSSFIVPPKAFCTGEWNTWCKNDELIPKINQAIYYLEYSYSLNDKIVEIGSLYNAIQDSELKARISDILTSPSHFDRAVNQATLVLEDRIRKKSSSASSLIGENLANKAINSDSKKSILLVSTDENEHKGYADIIRGVVGAFRNQTHHYLKDIKREEALKICGFIDHLLNIIDQSKLQNT